ncbi:MAG TPA: NADH-quinone oxidoreductase subunit J [Campylobacterales bacterium]|nr:NADH-quinone oxidoreductase subunit J [Campylobacterales bacterium]
MEVIAFYTFAIAIIASFLIVVTSKNVLYSMSALASGMVLISGLFFLLNAEFLGVVQIIVYTGAVIALYAFAMIFFDSAKDVKESRRSRAIFLLSTFSSILLVLLMTIPMSSDAVSALYPMHQDVGNAQDVGMVLFTKYLIPFEVAAVMLLVAMVGGIVMAGKKMDRYLGNDKEEISK